MRLGVGMRHLSRFLRVFCATEVCSALMQHQRQWLTQVLRKQFGYVGLQLGAVADYSAAWLSCPVQSHYVLAQQNNCDTHVLVHFEDLPIATHGVDVVVAAYALELSTDPYAVLRELDRVLIHDGRIVIMGFDPINVHSGRWWGKHRQAVSKLSLLGAARLVDMLQTLGYEIQQIDFFPTQRWRRWLAWLAPPFSQGYALLAHKKTARIQLIGLRDGWRWSRLLPQLARRDCLPAQSSADNAMPVIDMIDR